MDIQAALEQRGSALLGVGDFSFAAADPTDPSRVFKFGLHTADAWPAWAVFCREFPSPYTPVVHAFRWIESAAGHRIMYVAEVERLKPWDGLEHSVIRGLLGSSHLRKNATRLADAIGEHDWGLAAFLYQVSHAFPNGRHDMGPSNWMIRPGDGSLVLNDPLSYRANVGSTKGISI